VEAEVCLAESGLDSVAAKTPNFGPFDITKAAKAERKVVANEFFRSLLVSCGNR